MLSKLRPRSVYDVLAAIACFVALAGGTAYAANTIRTGDIVDNEVFTTDVRDDTLGFGGLQHQDLGPGSVRTSEIAAGGVDFTEIATGAIDSHHVLNASLNDEDVGQTVAVDFVGVIGTVNATSCVNRTVTGLNARGDHLLLTPNVDDAHGALVYSARYSFGTSNVIIHVCNFSTATVNDGNTHFNLLVFDAQ